MAAVERFGERQIGLAGQIGRVAAEGDREALASFLKRTGRENAFLGLEALARAPLLFWTRGPQAAIAAGISAAEHFAVAAATGSAGAAVGKRGNKGSRKAPEAQPTGNEGGGSGNGGGNRSITVIINSPVDEATIGQMNRSAESAARSKFDGIFD